MKETDREIERGGGGEREREKRERERERGEERERGREEAKLDTCTSGRCFRNRKCALSTCLSFLAHHYLLSESTGHGVGDGFLRFSSSSHVVYVPS